MLVSMMEKVSKFTTKGFIAPSVLVERSDLYYTVASGQFSLMKTHGTPYSERKKL